MDIWSELRDSKIKKAEVHFDGGNDDGGVDSIDYVMDDGTEKEINHDPEWEDGGNDTLEYRLVEPVYNRYSFLGMPYISGTLTYNVETEKRSWQVDRDYDE
jgi:hypothetical protein